MPEAEDLLRAYLTHLDARLRMRRAKPTAETRQLAVLPEAVAAMCSDDPRRCLDLILRALDASVEPEKIEAIGDQLLENLVNESSGRLAAEIAESLGRNRKFRQALACSNHSSVDPALIADWVQIFQDLGTTKEAERKSLRKMRLGAK